MEKPVCDLLVSAIEVNHHHGVGILLQRFFPDSGSFITLRSATLYGGTETFGRVHLELKSHCLTDQQTEARLRALLSPYRIRRILCVPYYREDFVHGLLAQRITGAPLCTYLMDDQNVFGSAVPDRRVRDLLAASRLRLCISPEMAAAYERKFALPCELLPPLLEAAEPLVPCYWQPEPDEPLRAAMIGNVWTDARFQQLRRLTRELNLQIDWYGNGPKASWLTGTPDEWEADHIRCLGFLPEEDLIASLASYPFVIVPSGSGEADDDNLAFSRLSLPSRLLFLHARTDTPVLLLGGAETAAGRFIRRLETGVCAGYAVDEIRAAITRLSTAPTRAATRAGVRRIAPLLVMPNAGEWLWQRLDGRTDGTTTFRAVFSDKENTSPSWLTEIQPIDPDQSAHAPSTPTVLRAAHLSLLPTVPPLVELTQFLRGVIEHHVRQALPRQGHVLILDPDAESRPLATGPDHFLWRVRDLAAWQAAEFPGDPSWFVGIGHTPAAHPPFGGFDVIASINWLDTIKDEAVLSRLAGFLSAHVAPGGLNAHGSTAVLHADYFWAGPALPCLRKNWRLPPWSALDEVLATEDTYFMDRAAYEQYWQPATGRSYENFGRAAGLLLFWRKPRPQPAPDRPGRPKHWLARLLGLGR